MLVVLSPAKTLDYSPIETIAATTPRLMDKSQKLVNVLKKKSVGDLQQIMGVSEKIAKLNVERYQTFSFPFSSDNAKPSMYAFKGDVYTGLEADTFTEQEAAFAQKHIRILSGLYGVLKPLDLMQPYRLEMGTKLKTGRKKNLYEFWGNDITRMINEDLEASESDILLNLASIEYFKSVNPKELKGKILNIDFKELRDGKLKVISFNAKKARGRMANLIVKEGITSREELKELVVNDYVFEAEKSDPDNFLFVKK